MKTTNVYICHRPYHILRSCDFVVKQKNQNRNILISFNVKTVGKGFQNHFRFPQLESFYDEVYYLNRDYEMNIGKWYSRSFYKYVRTRQKESALLINKIGPIDNVYFFSDTEYPIEILVGAVKRKTKAAVFLVDEGLVTYEVPQSHSVLERIKTWLSNKYLRLIQSDICTSGYGKSRLYDKAFAYLPDLSVFRNPIEKMEAISEIVLSRTPNILKDKGKILIFASNYAQHIPILKVTDKIEMKVLQNIKLIAEDNGYHFYIKPHPQQEKEEYAIFKDSVLDAQFPIEFLFNPDAVIISMFSSALLNAKYCGVPSICITKLFGSDYFTDTMQKLDIPVVSDFEDFERRIKVIDSK